jgi:uncharacterized protein YjbJ (UPF0337 family)
MSGKFEGTMRDVQGKAEEGIGKLTGDESQEMRGKVRQVAGHAQHTMSDAVESVRHLAADQPLTAILLAAGIGFIAGMLIVRR